MIVDAMVEFVRLPYIPTKLLVLYCSPGTPSCSIGGAALTRLGIGINDSVLSQYFVKDTVAIFHRIVCHFKHSPLVCTCLKEIQENVELLTNCLKQDEPTRWNSTFCMLQISVYWNVDKIPY